MRILNFLETGFLNLSLTEIIITLLVLTQITILAVTLYLHREQTHKGLKLHPVLQHFFRFWLWMTTGMLTKEWVAVHRKHHAYCETKDDPHSPHIHGIKRVLGNGVELYTEEKDDPETIEKYGKGTPDDWIERNLYTRFHFLGIAILFVIDLFLFGAIGITFWALQLIWIPFFAAGVVNGLGHWSGYRNYSTNDKSTNLTRLGFFIGGEELHNNHHAFPSSCKFSHKKGEFDWGWQVIKVLSFFKLAEIKKTVPELLEEKEAERLDADAVKAMLTHKVNLLQLYVKDVIKPTFKTEYKNQTRKFRKTGKKLIKSMSLDWRFLDEESRDAFKEYLKTAPAIDTLVEFRNELKSIWETNWKTSEQMLEALKEWCAKAEKSGHESLMAFSQKLKTYKLQTA